MACGDSCRRLSAGAGITITPDCCGGCVISATGAGPDPGACTCTLVEDANHPGVLITPGPTSGSYVLGLDPNLVETPAAAQQKADAVRQEAQACCDRTTGDIRTLTDRLNAFPPVPPAFLTPEQATQIADAAAQKAVDDHAAKTTDVHGIPDTASLETKDGAQAKADAARDAAVKAADDALKAHIASHPNGDGLTEDQARQIAYEAACNLLAPYKAVFADNFDNIDVDHEDWAPLDPPVAVTLKVPPSRQVMVTTCFTARNAETQMQTYQAVEIKLGDQVLMEPSDSRAVTLSADSPGDPSSACHSMIVDFAKLGDGAAKAGDEVTFTTTNRKANTPQDPGTGISTVLDRNISVVPLITCDGTGTPPDVGTGGVSEEKAQQIADTAAQKAVKAHTDTCHTLKITTEGVTAEEGWEVNKQELRSIGGTRTALIWLKRTGEAVSGKAVDDLAGDGKPEEGNIVPDLLIAKVTGDWVPPITQLHSAHTGYTTGSVRINDKGEIYLADLSSNNTLRTDQFLVFEYEFQVKTACESGQGNSGPEPPVGGITEEQAKQIADAAAKKAVDDHAAKTTDVHGIPDTAALETKDGAQAKADAAEKNALDSLRALVEKCLTLMIVNEGVTAEEGWEVNKQELRSIGGTHNAVIWLKRTGENISSKTIDQVAGDGQPEEGNLVPDLLIAKVTKDWTPAQTILVSAHTGYTTGSVRINTKGEIYLADLTSNNALRTDQFLVFTYTFLTEPDCAAAIKDPAGTPDASVKPDPQDPSGRTALLTIADGGGS